MTGGGAGCATCGHGRSDHFGRMGCTHRKSYPGAPMCPCPEFAFPSRQRAEENKAMSDSNVTGAVEVDAARVANGLVITVEITGTRQAFVSCERFRGDVGPVDRRLVARVTESDTFDTSEFPRVVGEPTGHGRLVSGAVMMAEAHGLQPDAYTLEVNRIDLSEDQR